jgi:hypothetical protein
MNTLFEQMSWDIYKTACIKLAAAAKGIPNPTAGSNANAGLKLPKLNAGGKAPTMAMPSINQNVANGLTQVTNNVPMMPMLPTAAASNATAQANNNVLRQTQVSF